MRLPNRLLRPCLADLVTFDAVRAAVTAFPAGPKATPKTAPAERLDGELNPPRTNECTKIGVPIMPMASVQSHDFGPGKSHLIGPPNLVL
jgi:hypothetical protein